MAWLDNVEGDDSLSEGAWRLARVFAKRQISNGRYAAVVISEAALEMNAEPNAVLTCLQELEDRGHARRLLYGPGFQINVALVKPNGGKP
jgi:hypothetical protein